MIEAIGVTCLVALLVSAALWAFTLDGKLEKARAKVRSLEGDLNWERRRRELTDEDLLTLRGSRDRTIEMYERKLEHANEATDRLKDLAHLFMDIHPGLADAFTHSNEKLRASVEAGGGFIPLSRDIDWSAVETYKKGLQAVEEFDEYCELRRKIQNNGKKEGPVEADS